MSLVITTDNMDFEEIPTGESFSRLYNIYDLGLQRAGEGNAPRHELVFLFELDSLKKDGTPHTVTQRFTASMHPKSNMRGFIESWKGSPYQDEEVRQYDVSPLIGKCAFVNIVRRPAEKGKKEWSEIFAIRARGNTPPFMTRLQPGYMPEWIKKSIDKQLPSGGGFDNDRGNQGGYSQGPQDMQGQRSGSGGNGKYTPPNDRTDF